jgi:hypothetical protein
VIKIELVKPADVALNKAMDDASERAKNALARELEYRISRRAL